MKHFTKNQIDAFRDRAYDKKESRLYKSINFKELTLCPMCKKPAKGIRPEGYMHPNGKGFETTYCKVEK